MGQGKGERARFAIVHFIEEEAARRAFDAAVLKWEGAHVAWEAITWAILHDPTVGKAVTESGKTRLFTYDGARSIKQPTITIIYGLRHGETVIHEARFTEAPFAQAGRA
jgi:hypothetical protein